MNYPTSFLKIGLSCLLGLSVAACGQSETDTPNAEGHTTLSSSLSRDTAPNVSDDDFDALTLGSRSFGLELYQALEKDQDNVLISPLSIRTAFGLLHAGAAGTTESDIETGLHFNLSGEDVYPLRPRRVRAQTRCGCLMVRSEHCLGPSPGLGRARVQSYGFPTSMHRSHHLIRWVRYRVRGMRREWCAPQHFADCRFRSGHRPRPRAQVSS